MLIKDLCASEWQLLPNDETSKALFNHMSDAALWETHTKLHELFYLSTELLKWFNDHKRACGVFFTTPEDLDMKTRFIKIINGKFYDIPEDAPLSRVIFRVFGVGIMDNLNNLAQAGEIVFPYLAPKHEGDIYPMSLGPVDMKQRGIISLRCSREGWFWPSPGQKLNFDFMDSHHFALWSQVDYLRRMVRNEVTRRKNANQ